MQIASSVSTTHLGTGSERAEAEEETIPYYRHRLAPSEYRLGYWVGSRLGSPPGLGSSGSFARLRSLRRSASAASSASWTSVRAVEPPEDVEEGEHVVHEDEALWMTQPPIYARGTTQASRRDVLRREGERPASSPSAGWHASLPAWCEHGACHGGSHGRPSRYSTGRLLSSGGRYLT